MSATESSSGSESESESSSSEDELLIRPVFLKKTKAPSVQKEDSGVQITLAKAEHHQLLQDKAVEKADYDGVDDTDDVNPEQEYKEWILREKQRKARDTLRMHEAEEAKEDAVRRKAGIAREGRQETESAKIGAFYTSEIDEKFLKRDYKDVEDSGDHSRPTKYRGRGRNGP